MRIHEYQAKRILAGFGVPVLRGETASTPAEARETATRLGGRVVLKAQVHAGGRGKAGGVRAAASPAEAEAAATAMLGSRLVTAQTGPGGVLVRSLLVEEAVDVVKEMYLSAAIDRGRERPVLLASALGGVEVEQAAGRGPGTMTRVEIHPAAGLRDYQVKSIAIALGLNGDLAAKAANLIRSLFRAFEAADASLVEVNPLALARDGVLAALDAKIELDDNALARHPDLQALRDWEEMPAVEAQAVKAGLSYVKMSGDVGCMVNGAGLAMATMDMVQLCGGQPANFLDVGGGVSQEAVGKAFAILVSDKDVRSALVNIFGGIVRCDLVAAGIVGAARTLALDLPVVVRLQGTNAEAGRTILEESGLPLTFAEDMDKAARLAIELAASRRPGS